MICLLRRECSSPPISMQNFLGQRAPSLHRSRTRHPRTGSVSFVPRPAGPDRGDVSCASRLFNKIIYFTSMLPFICIGTLDFLKNRYILYCPTSKKSRMEITSCFELSMLTHSDKCLL